MTKFRTGGWGDKLIVEVEVERESDTSVWIKGRRNNKRSSFENFFNTWDEAKTYLLELAEREVASCRRQLELANGKLGNIKGLKNPKPEEEHRILYGASCDLFMIDDVCCSSETGA